MPCACTRTKCARDYVAHIITHDFLPDKTWVVIKVPVPQHYKVRGRKPICRWNYNEKLNWSVSKMLSCYKIAFTLSVKYRLLYGKIPSGRIP